MGFKITARTLLHLGADLISSDEIALYELVKNAFDASSKDVEIKCNITIPGESYFSALRELRQDIDKHTSTTAITRAVDRWKVEFLANVDNDSPNVTKFNIALRACETLVDVLRAVEDANSIEVTDEGSGMSAKDLEDVYLTIGTTSRLREKIQRLVNEETKGERPILGDKGVGRLATMRLGSRLHVETTEEGESYWNVLAINWEDFRENLEARLEDIDVAPTRGAMKKDCDTHGTTIRISGLKSEWTFNRLEQVSKDHIAKLSDPFATGRFPVVPSFNGRAVKVPKFNDLLTKHAHADCSAKLIIDGEDSTLEGTVNYRLAEKGTAFALRGAHLLSAANAASIESLVRLGPFSVEFYWFNRQALKASMKTFENADEIRQVIKLQEWWAGGLMVYRDGFRVNPYGSGDDDWLNLDAKALASSGYKVNRRQLVGRVSLSSRRNPHLTDQTNREGLQDSSELRSLIALLRYILIKEFKAFLQRIDDSAEQHPSLTVREIRDRVSKEKRTIGSLVKRLRQEVPRIDQETKLLQTLEESVKHLELLSDEARRQIDSYEEAQEKVIHLAATGLLVEMLAHELNRATRHTIRALEDGRQEKLSESTSALFRTLETQLRTLQKRISVLDPLSTSGRQVKETFDLAQWVTDICATRRAQFKRHNINFDLTVIPKKPDRPVKVTMVKGMLVQILENLFDNSVYWLKQQSKLNRKFRPSLSVEIDTSDFTISVTDNGPGIDPVRRADIFQPFYSTKPDEGKGLGLFISREVAKYHKADLELSDVRGEHENLHTFILHLGKVAA